MRSWKERNRTRVADYQRAWHAQIDTTSELATNRKRYKANRLRMRERDNAARLRWRHGFLSGKDKAAMWQAQDGKCYLCGREMTPGREAVDHDHSCCPKDRSCSICRRGLACRKCNLAIGHADDDPARLRRMADALEAANLAVKARKASAAIAETLFLLSSLLALGL